MSTRRSFTVALLGAASIAVLASSPSAAQRASLLVDVNATRLEDGPGRVGTFHDLRQVGDKLFFVSNDAAVGSELWVSDGTPAGTEVVRDLCPGRCDGSPVLLDALGPVLLWSADGELWRSDGTRPGTFALTAPGLAVNVSMGHAAFRGSLYFVVCAPFATGEPRDCDLWRTDGSVAGTQVFHHATSTLSWMRVAGERIYFLRNDASGAELFVTDGTAAGTVRLRRFDTLFERPRSAVAAGGRLFFIAWQDGQEVWTSDGTAAGTRRLTSFQPVQPFLFAAWLKPAGNRVYFVADDGAHGHEIWRADGTAAGTVRVTDFVDETPFFDREPSLLVEVGGRLVFEVDAADSPSPLWTSAGTPSSTAPLMIPCGGCHLHPLSSFVVSGDQAFFIAQENNDASLWVTDGTAAGTREVSDRCYSCSTEVLQPWNGGVLFPAGSEIWFTDGTAAGTLRFAALAEAEPVDSLFNVVGLGGNAYFFADGPDTWGLWVRDAEGKTRPVYSFPVAVPSSAPRHLTAFDDRLLFTAWDGGSANDSLSLWSSGGSPETTARVPVPALHWGWAKDFVRVGGLLFFQAGEGNEPHDLWRTDGTAAGTFVVAHLQGEGKLIPYQDALYFFDGGWIWRTDGTVDGTEKTGELPSDLTQIEVAAPGANGIYIKGAAAGSGTEFWFTDGTTAGTRQITHLNRNGVIGHPPEFTRFGSHVYFSLEGLWRSDGTEAGTSKLPLEMSRFGYPTKLAVHQGALYFFVATPGYSSPYELRLWRTDGKTFTELASFPGQDTFYFPVALTPFGDQLYFNVDDGVHGIELWTTDGTPAGTRLVSDVFPGRRSSSPTQLTVAGDRFYFAAGDDLHGIELWESDGTAAGTRLVQDIAPQADSSSPGQLTLADGNLFFTADDGISGREVWVLAVGGAAACRPSTTRLCLGGGRYAVEAAWRDFQGHRGSGRAATLTADTGYFWFFDPANVEVILKVLDGRGLNDHVWVFYGALSSVEYTLTVTDTETGLAHRYRNPGGQLASVADTRAFGPLGASAKRGAAAAAPPSIVERRVTSKTTACAASSTRLCLNGGRFAVEVAWKDFTGNTGVGHAAPLTGDTGTFWFFGESNVELVVKVLDGRPLNGRHWLFYGALSSVEYTVTVTDTQTGNVKVYTNPSGRLASVADVDAF